ncbi:acetyl-CoA carboxylase biotin carboxyl carrier protein [Leadbetterella byssophila]|uniref:acetyl-CoA carboxylase biotin carboxyl carrier protein n=1 Tax=Leadbetterella byssophila TaxID=316068 RepID=UPI0039A01D55
MDTKEIQKLIEFISKTDLSEVKIETSDLKIQVRRGGGEAIKVVPAAAPVVYAEPAAPAPKGPEVSAAPAPSSSKVVEIKAPMIGTFYRSAGPDKPPFVEVGDEVSSGKVICILEAMKLFNEIESEVSGKIVKILVDDATPVEYDQPLFLVELA